MLDLERLQKELAASGKTESLRALADSPEGKKIAKMARIAGIAFSEYGGDRDGL